MAVPHHDPAAEAATTRGADIDFENKTWTISAERMKNRRRHIIPFTEQAFALVEAIKPYRGLREHVFPADTARPPIWR